VKYRIPIALLLLATATRAATTTSSPTTLPSPTIAVTVGEEEHKKVVRATVTLNGKPLENATVTISVRRTFGTMLLGKDATLDDGTAVAPFPADLPAGPGGELRLVAEVAASPKYAAAVAETTAPGRTIHAKSEDAFPRALWAPRAPIELLVPIFVLLGGVWITYAFVVSQLIAIWRGARQ
jgi:hypothetical protein